MGHTSRAQNDQSSKFSATTCTFISQISYNKLPSNNLSAYNQKITIYRNLCYKIIKNVGSLFQKENWAKAASKIVHDNSNICFLFYFVHLSMCCSSITYLIFLFADEAPSTLSKTMKHSRHKHIPQLLRQDIYDQVNRYVTKF